MRGKKLGKVEMLNHVCLLIRDDINLRLLKGHNRIPFRAGLQSALHFKPLSTYPKNALCKTHFETWNAMLAYGKHNTHIRRQFEADLREETCYL